MSTDAIHQEIKKSFGVDGTGTFGVARVIGRNDWINSGRVRLYPLSETKDFAYIENHRVEHYPLAEPLSMAKGENHGIYYTPEFGDFVIYTVLPTGYYILGSIANPSWKYSAVNIPAEAQNIQKNGVEYNVSHYDDLTTKGYHLEDPKLGDKYQPAAFLQRWRRNDILMYNTTKIGTESHSAAKLMEFRSAENNMLQLVDIGNFNTKPGIEGKNAKKYSPARQTDYRDLWESFTLNDEYWVNRTEIPPKTNESNYIRLATNSSVGSDRDSGCDGKDANWGDTGADLPDLTRGEVRWDDRVSEGSHETSKTYCPVYQTVKSAPGPDRYYQDKDAVSPWEASLPYRMKVKKWIEDTGDPYDPEAHHFNVGHFLTLSNTIFKRRAMLGSAKGHQLVMSDIDIDEKLIMSSHRGKYLYMEDSMPGNYEVMWLASQKHHMIWCDNQVAPYLHSSNGGHRHRLLDPNQMDLSSYQLIQTEKYQKIWLTDSPKCPRIHLHSTHGHELLLLDHDYGTVGISPPVNKGRIQLTTGDKLQQIIMDEQSGDITIQNHNLAGDSSHGSGKELTGDISIFAMNNIKLHAMNMIEMRADAGYDIQSAGGSYNVIACSISHSTPCGSPHIPSVIRPTVLTDIDVTEGKLINIWDPS